MRTLSRSTQNVADLVDQLIRSNDCHPIRVLTQAELQHPLQILESPPAAAGDAQGHEDPVAAAVRRADHDVHCGTWSGSATFGTFSPALLAMSFIYADLENGSGDSADRGHRRPFRPRVAGAAAAAHRAAAEHHSDAASFYASCSACPRCITRCPAIGAEVVLLADGHPDDPDRAVSRECRRRRADAHDQARRRHAGRRDACATWCWVRSRSATLCSRTPRPTSSRSPCSSCLGGIRGYRLTELWRFRDLVETGEAA